MRKRIEFTVNDIEWLVMMYPECEGTFDGNAFECTYALEEDERGHQRYELLTGDGRTNYNDLNGYEKMCLFDCQSYFDNRLHIVGFPDYCTNMKTFIG